MNDPLQALLDAGAVPGTQYPPNSRYSGVGTTTFVRPDGSAVAHLQRRFIPAPERFAVIEEHSVVQRDRLDLLAARYFGDPVLFWRLCDANRAMRPDELLEKLGRHLMITLPEGTPGMSDV